MSGDPEFAHWAARTITNMVLLLLVGLVIVILGGAIVLLVALVQLVAS